MKPRPPCASLPESVSGCEFGLKLRCVATPPPNAIFVAVRSKMLDVTQNALFMCLRLGVWGLGFGVRASRARRTAHLPCASFRGVLGVEGLGFRVANFGLRVLAFSLGPWCLWCMGFGVGSTEAMRASLPASPAASSSVLNVTYHDVARDELEVPVSYAIIATVEGVAEGVLHGALGHFAVGFHVT